MKASQMNPLRPGRPSAAKNATVMTAAYFGILIHQSAKLVETARVRPVVDNTDNQEEHCGDRPVIEHLENRPGHPLRVHRRHAENDNAHVADIEE